MSRSLNSTGSTVGEVAADGAGTALHCFSRAKKKCYSDHRFNVRRVDSVVIVSHCLFFSLERRDSEAGPKIIHWMARVYNQS